MPGYKTQITVLGCASASGYSLPPFVCFDRKNLNLKLTEGELPGTVPFMDFHPMAG